eukprot:COSAG01_NODE_53947_length_335_cov_1.538136_1_plen_71_part_10
MRLVLILLGRGGHGPAPCGVFLCLLVTHCCCCLWLNSERQQAKQARHRCAHVELAQPATAAKIRVAIRAAV